MKYLVQVIRFFIAITFIFSGIVKLIDPIGTKIKMLEYFSEDVLNLTFLSPYALEISFFIILFECILGVALLLGYRIDLTLKLLFLLTTFFLFLTWYSAYYNKVTDCGCFGDAIKLSAWETFYKNVIFLIMITFLIFKKKFIFQLFNSKINTIILITITILSSFLMIYTIKHLPLIDFRPYAIGQNIKEGMSIPKDAPQPKFKEIWYYKINGEIKEFSTEDEPWNIEGAEFVDRKTITISEGYVPPIHDFSIDNEMEGDITEQVLNEPEIYLIISYQPSAVGDEEKKIINDYAQKLTQKGKKVIGLFAVTDEQIIKSFQFPLYLTDATTLKTMIRSNPGVIKLEYGTITEKYAWRNLK